MTTNIGFSNIELTEGNVSVNWSDGHISNYEARHLRLNCGCAECVEEWTKRRLLDPVTVDHDIKVEDYIPVGKYAVQFLWSDAHYTGIFPFDMLRGLCRCDECNSSRD